MRLPPAIRAPSNSFFELQDQNCSVLLKKGRVERDFKCLLAIHNLRAFGNAPMGFAGTQSLIGV